MASGKRPLFPDANIDAFITDYVDGTMDNATRLAFEELMEQTPALKAEVCQMKELRNFMCGLNCGCNLEASQIASSIRQEVFQGRCANGFSVPNWFKKEENIRLSIGVASVSLILLILTGNIAYKKEREKALTANLVLSTHLKFTSPNTSSALPNKTKPKYTPNHCPSKIKK